MALSLAVVTHTCKSLNRDLTRCVQSVKSALPAGATHHIIDCEYDYDIFQQARYAAMALADVIVFVDDDDYISPDSLHKCLNALEHTDAGIAFTYEVKVGVDGLLTRNNPARYYHAIQVGPEAIHHMTAFRSVSVSSRSLDLLEHGAGIEWIMKADAAFAHGAVFVPINGYYWVQHPKQHHRTREHQSPFNARLLYTSNELSKWNTRGSEFIPE